MIVQAVLIIVVVATKLKGIGLTAGQQGKELAFWYHCHRKCNADMGTILCMLNANTISKADEYEQQGGSVKIERGVTITILSSWPHGTHIIAQCRCNFGHVTGWCEKQY